MYLGQCFANKVGRHPVGRHPVDRHPVDRHLRSPYRIGVLTPDSKIRFLFPHMTNGTDKSLFVIFCAVSCPSFLEARFYPATRKILRRSDDDA